MSARDRQPAAIADELGSGAWRPRRFSARRRIAQARTRIRLGYLHVVAVDGQIWTGLDRGSFDKQGIDFELHRIQHRARGVRGDGGGKLDVAVRRRRDLELSGARAGRAFLINDIEVATAQLWVRPDLGVSTFADLKGKPDRDDGQDDRAYLPRPGVARQRHRPGRRRDAQQQHVRRGAAFIAGEVPAVALWVPFNIAVREKLPDAIKLVDASAFYPQSAVVGGWVARHDYYADNSGGAGRIIRGWAEANDYMVRNPAAAAEALQKNHYSRRGRRHHRGAQGAKDVFLARMEAPLFGRHRRQMAAAGQRFLHDGCRRT